MNITIYEKGSNNILSDLQTSIVLEKFDGQEVLQYSFPNTFKANAEGNIQFDSTVSTGGLPSIIKKVTVNSAQINNYIIGIAVFIVVLIFFAIKKLK